MKKIILLFTFCFVLSTTVAFAALIPCEGLECQFCHFAELIGRVINFGLKLVIPIGVVFIAWGGLEILTAAGSTEKAKKGKDILTAAVIGIVIALTAWLLLSTLLQIITGQGFTPWKLGAGSFCNK
ncbi:MAG: hypothetical protein AAB885_01400 [Patescibacteria group bacterium]